MKRLLGLVFIVFLLFSIAPVMAQDVEPVMVEASLDMVGIIEALLPWATFVMVLVAVMRSGNFKQADVVATEQVGVLQGNSAQMRMLEMQYANSDKVIKALVDMTQVVVENLAPLTSVTFDDAANDLLKDIQAVGPPVVDDSDKAVAPFVDIDMDVMSGLVTTPPSYGGKPVQG